MNPRFYIFIATLTLATEKRKKALQKVAAGHTDDAVTPDDIEIIIPSPVANLVPSNSAEVEKQKKPKESPAEVVATPEKTVVTAKPDPKPAHNYEDDFPDPYWN